jgi:hypothetical protein
VGLLARFKVIGAKARVARDTSGGFATALKVLPKRNRALKLSTPRAGMLVDGAAARRL